MSLLRCGVDIWCVHKVWTQNGRLRQPKEVMIRIGYWQESGLNQQVPSETSSFPYVTPKYNEESGSASEKGWRIEVGNMLKA
jgi:hypothetical protein